MHNAPAGAFLFTAVEEAAGKLQLGAHHPDNHGERDVQAWLEIPEVVTHQLWEDPHSRIGAFVETSAGSTCALVGEGGVYYVLDSHSYDSRTGRKDGRESGKAVIIRLSGLEELFSFLRTLIARGQHICISQVYF